MNKAFLVAFAMLAVTFTGCIDLPELEQGESAPIVTFFITEDSAGVYHVEVVKISKLHELAGFSFFLKDDSDATYVGGNGFGEIAMQNISGELHGINTAYKDSCTSCDSQLESRTDNVTADNGADFPVHFSDNDRDGMLSAGDEFEVYGQGNGANGPAEDGWSLAIQFDASGDIIGTAKLL